MLRNPHASPPWLRLRAIALGCALAGVVHAQPPEAASADRDAPAQPTHTMRSGLRELDRFLDHHPLLEDDLRRDPQRVQNGRYLAGHPELRELLTNRPAITQALAHEPRHFLYRALQRQAGSLLRRSEVTQLDAYLDGEPAIERLLTINPALIRDEGFLHAHAALRDFVAAHSALARAFLPASPNAPR